MSARLTCKTALAPAIGLLLVAAFGARAGGVRGIDRLEWDASHRAFVSEKGAKLVKRPTVVPIPLRAADVHPIADAREVFNANALSFGPGFLNDAFADAVVDRLLEPTFTSLQSPEQFSRTASAFGLQGRSRSVIPITDAVYLFAAKRCAAKRCAAKRCAVEVPSFKVASWTMPRSTPIHAWSSSRSGGGSSTSMWMPA